MTLTRHTGLAQVCAAFIALAVPATAQEQVAVPEGCVPLGSAHKLECAVSHHFQCGDLMMTHNYVDGVLENENLFDADGALIHFLYQGSLGSETRFDVVEGQAADMSYEKLLADGVSEGVTDVIVNNRIIRDRKYEMFSENRLSADVVELSGIAFRKGTMHRKLLLNGTAAGIDLNYDILVHPERKFFIGSAWTRAALGSSTETFNHVPQTFVTEGAPGYLTASSEFGCD